MAGLDTSRSYVKKHSENGNNTSYSRMPLSAFCLCLTVTSFLYPWPVRFAFFSIAYISDQRLESLHWKSSFARIRLFSHLWKETKWRKAYLFPTVFWARVPWRTWLPKRLEIEPNRLLFPLMNRLCRQHLFFKGLSFACICDSWFYRDCRKKRIKIDFELTYRQRWTEEKISPQGLRSTEKSSSSGIEIQNFCLDTLFFDLLWHKWKMKNKPIYSHDYDRGTIFEQRWILTFLITGKPSSNLILPQGTRHNNLLYLLLFTIGTVSFLRSSKTFS